jgi:hypothetical protein
MRKLALDLSALRVQSFDTLPAVRDGRGTVVARQESATYDEQGCTDACTVVQTCYSCDTCSDACDPDTIDPTDMADPNRRIILY